MLKSVLLAACFCALALPAHARPKHNIGDAANMVGCSQPDMRPCEGRFARGYFGEEITKKSLRHRHFRHDSGRKEITHHNTARPRAWCGWWLGRHLGMHDRRLWRALAWRHVGRAAHGPAIGTVVIWSRGKGSGHVGIITGKTDRGWVVKSGNDGNAVRERVRSVAGAIAFRWP